MDKLDVSKLSVEEKFSLLCELQVSEQEEKNRRRDAYEGLKSQHLADVKVRFYEYVRQGKDFIKWLRGETESFFAIMSEYGKLNRSGQLGYKVSDEGFKYQVRGNRVKGFDERADMAEKRLVDFLKRWIEDREGGVANPMYKLAMAMIQRNEYGDLDYKSVSRLYELEADFNDPEYSDIMRLFKESNVVNRISIKFYFEEKDRYNTWHKLEPSFNRL